ncbi:hypothetical protein BT69DRAFT_1281542 [Atractiella rhizophila]|nr:hypothetical protein BT69DRAFT_1281542 [Atractiella rhizophila]
MNKTVVVFSGVYGWENFNATPASLSSINVGCPECTAHAGALQAWLEVKEETNDMAVVQEVETYNGHIWSMTGHGFGAMVAQIGAVDLGYRNLAHAVHSFGSPRVFNPAGAALFNKLFEGSSNTRTVANDDAIPQTIPESDDYTHVLGGFHVFGSGNATFGQNYEYCSYSVTDPNCLGGDSRADHWFYYTTPGTCGDVSNATTYNPTYDESYEASQSSSYAAVSTVPISLNLTTPTSTSSLPTTSSTSSSVVPLTITSTTAAPAAPTQSTGSQAEQGGNSAAGVVAVGKGFMVLVAAVVAMVSLV